MGSSYYSEVNQMIKTNIHECVLRVRDEWGKVVQGKRSRSWICCLDKMLNDTII